MLHLVLYVVNRLCRQLKRGSCRLVGYAEATIVSAKSIIVGPILDSMFPKDHDCIVVEFGRPTSPSSLAASVQPSPDAIKARTNRIFAA